MKAHAIIGANYGDEGKGAIVDRVTHDAGAPVVVRFNGGAQAGHTVCAGGKRHVFHHIGAGTFAGADTYLSRFFVCNPILFNQEYDALAKILPGGEPLVMVDPCCIVTTPWDMLVNQAVEEVRGPRRHGSCGVGFNETIERCSDPRYRLTVSDLAHYDLRRRSMEIRRYSWDRYLELGVPQPDREKFFNDDSMLQAWLQDAMRFLRRIFIAPQERLREKSTLVFEGAQGLMLDQNNRADFPHLTRSNTGIRNVLRICGELGVQSLEATYVTRTYLTRHGAGPLPREGELTFRPDEDLTNVDHPFQGALRVAPLDVEALVRRIRADFSQCGGSHMVCRKSLAVTHCDQSMGLLNDCMAGPRYASNGPRREDIRVEPIGIRELRA